MWIQCLAAIVQDVTCEKNHVTSFELINCTKYWRVCNLDSITNASKLYWHQYWHISNSTCVWFPCHFPHGSKPPNYHPERKNKLVSSPSPDSYPYVSSLVCAFFMCLTPLWIVISSKHPASRTLLYSGWEPVITAMVISRCVCVVFCSCSCVCVCLVFKREGTAILRLARLMTHPP